MEDFTDEAKEKVGEAMDRGADWVETAREKVEPLRAAIRNR